MKTKLKAEFVKEKAEKYLRARNARIQSEYENAIIHQMKPRLSNLYRGKNREQAIKYLNRWRTNSLFKDFMSMLSYKGRYSAMIVEDALKMSNLAIDNGEEYVWITNEELFFL